MQDLVAEGSVHEAGGFGFVEVGIGRGALREEQQVGGVVDGGELACEGGDVGAAVKAGEERESEGQWGAAAAAGGSGGAGLGKVHGGGVRRTFRVSYQVQRLSACDIRVEVVF